jgi:hypothetical protein
VLEKITRIRTFARQRCRSESEEEFINNKEMSMVSPELKIDILLKEYDTLRTEILNKINTRYGIIGFLGALFAFVLNKWEWQPKNCPFDTRWPVVIIGLLILFGIWLWIGVLIQGIAVHICSIEKRINQLAGDELLSWETHCSLGCIWKLREKKYFLTNKNK